MSNYWGKRTKFRGMCKNDVYFELKNAPRGAGQYRL